MFPRRKPITPGPDMAVRRRSFPLLIGSILLLLATGTWLLAEVKVKPAPEPVPKAFLGKDEDAHLDKTPPRYVKRLELNHVGFKYDCMECHQQACDNIA